MNKNVIVTKNNFTQIPKLGAFEVSCMGYLLYSKIKTGTFP